jgi:predicted DCC family thiol-disulfide oxidoreductase YuxK
MRGVLVFDGDCGFCTWSAVRIERWSSGSLDVVPWQRADLEGLGLTPAQCSAAVQFVGARGVASGGAAVARALQQCRQPWRAVGHTLEQPWLAPVVERGYVVVAANRHRLPGATPACLVPASEALHGDERRLGGIGGDRPSQSVTPPLG